MTDDALRIECSQNVKNILCEALINYASFADHANPAPLTSAQVDALVDDINHQFAANGKCVKLNRELYDYCYQAIHFHYERINYLLNANVDQQRDIMLNLIHGEPTCDADLDQALQLDQVV